MFGLEMFFSLLTTLLRYLMFLSVTTSCFILNLCFYFRMAPKEDHRLCFFFLIYFSFENLFSLLWLFLSYFQNKLFIPFFLFFFLGGSISTNQFLSHVSLQVIANRSCSIGFPFVIQASNICTRGFSGLGTCSGDSGGPLAVSRNGQPLLVNFYLSKSTNTYTRILLITTTTCLNKVYLNPSLFWNGLRKDK